jgi:hypothetical protein
VPAAGGEYALVGGPLLWDGGALMQHAALQLQNLRRPPFVALHPSDMQAGHYTEGHRATVTANSSTGSTSIMLTLCADPSVLPGTAWVPYGQTGLPAETLGAGRGEPVSVTIALDVSSLN